MEQATRLDRSQRSGSARIASATGRPIAEFHGARTPGPLSGLPLVKLFLAPEREALRRAIDARFEAMIGHGALGEVEALRDVADQVDVEAGEAGVGGGVEVLERRVGHVGADGEGAAGDEVEAAARAVGCRVGAAARVVAAAGGEGDDEESGDGRAGEESQHGGHPRGAASSADRGNTQP